MGRLWWQTDAAEQVRVPGVGTDGFKLRYPIEKCHRNTEGLASILVSLFQPIKGAIFVTG